MINFESEDARFQVKGRETNLIDQVKVGGFSRSNDVFQLWFPVKFGSVEIASFKKELCCCFYS